MTIQIDGHKLPDILNRVVAEGKWKTPLDRNLWLTMVEERHVVQPSLYPLEQLNGRSVWKSDAGDAFVGVPDEYLSPGFIDPSNAVIIGDLGPERFIAIDLRASKESPPVCAFLPRDDNDSCWVEIAKSIETFIDLLKLAGNKGGRSI